MAPQNDTEIFIFVGQYAGRVGGGWSPVSYVLLMCVINNSLQKIHLENKKNRLPAGNAEKLLGLVGLNLNGLHYSFFTAGAPWG